MPFIQDKDILNLYRDCYIRSQDAIIPKTGSKYTVYENSDEAWFFSNPETAMVFSKIKLNKHREELKDIINSYMPCTRITMHKKDGWGFLWLYENIDIQADDTFDRDVAFHRLISLLMVSRLVTIDSEDHMLIVLLNE